MPVKKPEIEGIVRAKHHYPQPTIFRTIHEEIEYLREEKERWRNGYNGLTGPHYFYITQFKIKDGTDGDIITPRYRDCDEYVFKEIEKAMANGEDLLWVARRGIGKTSIIACMAVWTMVMYPGSVSMLTSSNKDKIQTIYSERIIEVWPYLHEYIQGTIEKKNNTVSKMEFGVLYQAKDKNNGAILNKISRLYCPETNETPSSPTNMSSKRAKFVAIDEIGLHNRREKVLSSSADTLISNGVRTGFRMLAGTIESDIPAESVAELQKLVMDKAALKIRVVFSPYWHGLNMDEYGISNKSKSEIKWKEDYERLSSASDKKSLNAFLKNQPPDLETALSIGGVGMLPEEVIAQVAHQERSLLTKRVPIQRGLITPDQSRLNGMDFRLSPDGNTFIFEHPIEGEHYVGGIDPIPFNTDNMSDKNSRHVGVIIRMSTRAIVCIYKDRSPDPDDISRKQIWVQRYYNNAVAMLEANAGGLLLDRFVASGKLDLLANTPLKCPIPLKKSKHNKGYWKAGNNQLEAHLTELLTKYLLRYSDTLFFAEKDCSVFIEIPYYMIKNTDILDAILAALLYIDELEKLGMNQKKKVRFKEVKMLQMTPKGIMPVWIKIPINATDERGKSGD